MSKENNQEKQVKLNIEESKQESDTKIDSDINNNNKQESEKKEIKQENKEKLNQTNSTSLFYSLAILFGILIILGLILVSIKIFSPPSADDIKEDIIKHGRTDDGYMYNGFIFIKRDNLWHTEWQRGDLLYNLHFHYSPAHVDQISVTGSLNENQDTSKVYVTFNPLEENISLIGLAASELSLNLVKGLGTKITPACTKNETPGCHDRPIITCDNTNESVFYVKTGKETGIFLDGNCVVIQGSGNDLLKAVDKTLYDFYGIIPKKQTN
jgi:hypothetical protein